MKSIIITLIGIAVVAANNILGPELIELDIIIIISSIILNAFGLISDRRRYNITRKSIDRNEGLIHGLDMYEEFKIITKQK